MTSLSDYKKFDHLDSDSNDQEEEKDGWNAKEQELALRVASACRIEDDAATKVKAQLKAIFQPKGGGDHLLPFMVGGYFDSSKGYIDFDTTGDDPGDHLEDLRAGLRKNENVDAVEWRGAEAVAFLHFICKATMAKRPLIEKALAWATSFNVEEDVGAAAASLLGDQDTT
mmetsp:Transcript_19605/g.61409  ORF Transcript_19605/g.61409 Transcript_19605/m.61409 type:complete len:170 (-) Transcript_19605:57-566(-)